MSSDLRRYATSRVGRGCGVASGLSNGSWVSGSWLGGLSWRLAGWRVRIGAMPTVPRALRHKQNVTDSKPAGCVLPIPAGSPRPASARGLGTSARRPPSPPVRRNPANPARAGRQAPRTATRHHATTWEKRPRESSPSRQSANAQVKRQAKRQTPPCPDCFIAGRSAPWPSECCDNGPLSLPSVIVFHAAHQNASRLSPAHLGEAGMPPAGRGCR
jgi:hypothetical protein